MCGLRDWVSLIPSSPEGERGGSLEREPLPFMRVVSALPADFAMNGGRCFSFIDLILLMAVSYYVTRLITMNVFGGVIVRTAIRPKFNTLFSFSID